MYEPKVNVSVLVLVCFCFVCVLFGRGKAGRPYLDFVP